MILVPTRAGSRGESARPTGLEPSLRLVPEILPEDPRAVLQYAAEEEGSVWLGLANDYA